MVVRLPDPLKVDTEFVVEMGLVAEFAGGSIKDWERRSWAERRMWVYYKLLQNAKIKHAEDEAKKDQPQNKFVDAYGRPLEMPEVERPDRPGIRS